MPVLATTNPTLADVAKRLDPDGKIAAIVEILNETNEILFDMPWIEGNLPTGHRSTIRTGIPEPTWRKLYGGVQPTRSTTTQVTDNCGMLEAYAESDKALADLNGNTAAFRLSEERPHIEGMSQELAKTLFYGNEGTLPESFTGFAPRFNDRTPSVAASADNVIHGGGSGSDNTSIWLVVWGEQSVHGIYPKGQQAGLSMKDMGEVTIENADGQGGRMQAYRSHYKWNCGLTVRDWRYIVRIANIDISDLTKDAQSGADLLDLIAQAFEQVPSLSVGRPVLYCNRTIKSFLRRQQKNSKNVQISMEQVLGRRVMVLDEVPVRRCDAILNTEALVPAS
ncbi:MAG: major capsid protein [Burkholderiaceae bacterium]